MIHKYTSNKKNIATLPDKDCSVLLYQLSMLKQKHLLILVWCNTRRTFWEYCVHTEGKKERKRCNREEKDLAYMKNKSYKVAVKYDQWHEDFNLSKAY